MLRISVQDSPQECNLIVEGKLTTPWIDELQSAWKSALEDLCGRRLVVDLRDVTAISAEGESMLLKLLNSGASFRSNGLFTRHIVRNLLRRKYRSGGIYEHDKKAPQ